MNIDFKKILLSALLFVAAAVVSAADARWTVYPLYGGGEKIMVDAADRVYFANGGLFSYDKTSHEQEAYGDRLNGRTVSLLRYNADRGFLFIGYADSNIDLLFDDGRVLNMPQISISDLAPCSISDVLFDGRHIYVATSFGIVKLDSSTGEVVESGIYGGRTSGLALTSTRLVINYNNFFYSIERGKSINKIDNFTKNFYSPLPLEVRFLSDGHMLCRTKLNGDYAFRHYTVDLDINMLYSEETLHNRIVPPLMEAKGVTYAQIDGDIYEFAADGSMTRRLVLPDAIATDTKTMDGAADCFLALGPEGVCNVRVGDGASMTTLVDRFKPDAVFTLEAAFFAPSRTGREVYVYNYGNSAYKPFSSTNQTPLAATKIDLRTGATSDATPYPVDAVTGEVGSWQQTAGRYPLNPTMIAVDPDDPDTYYLATGNDGVYKIRGGECIGVFGYDNSPVNEGWGPSVFGVHIDRGGNLWMVHYRGNTTSISVLPSAMRARPVSDVKKADWISIDGDGFSAASDVAFLECQRSGMIFIASHGSGFRLLAYDTNNTPDNFNDDKALLWTSLTDQDGKSWTPTRRICFAEDRNGRVWFGTNEGIYQFTSPRQAVDPSMRVQKLKIPRNDGTNEADYLAGNDMVFDIAVDTRNRKWLATANSGLVCVNESGNAILQTFDPQNSPLLDNCVLSAWADPSSSDIYVGTLYGLMRFTPTVDSAAGSFDEIMAYPNPVRPEYSGPVYVRGLMENSLVKIADSAGGVVAQGRAENGTFRWDVCDASGCRVRTGVYFVFASQNASGSSSGAVTKIMVVN